MIRTRYNRYILNIVVIVFLIGFVFLLRYGILPLFVLWVTCAAVVLVTRCPQCGVLTGRNKSGVFTSFVPKRCRNCGYEYK